MIGILPSGAVAAADELNRNPGLLADVMLGAHRSFGTLDLSSLSAQLSELSARDRALAQSVTAEITPRLSVVEQAELAAWPHTDGPEVVVTARRGAGSDAGTSVAPDLIERPIEVRNFGTLSELQAARHNFQEIQAQTGRQPGDEYIEAGFDKAEADLEAGTAVANRAALDVVKLAIPPLETAAAAWRLGVNGEYTLENGLVLGGALGGAVLGAVGRGVIGVGGDEALLGAENAPLFSRVVPGGGLAVHEAAQGHLLLKHVGQTEAQLLARLAAEPGISGSSSFYNRAVAESAVSDALDANAGNVSNWLSGSSGRLRIDHTGQVPVGISVNRGTASAIDVNSTRLILIRDPELPIGYRIQTGFPTKP